MWSGRRSSDRLFRAQSFDCNFAPNKVNAQTDRMNNLILGFLAVCLSASSVDGQLAVNGATKVELSLSSVLLSPSDGTALVMTNDFRRDVTAFTNSLPEDERALTNASIVVNGTRAGGQPKPKDLGTPHGIPKGMILKAIGEHHGASLVFDGAKIHFHFRGTPSQESKRWYAISPALIAAFAKEPNSGSVPY